MLIQIGSSWPTEKPGGVPTYFRFFLRELVQQVGEQGVQGYVAGSSYVAAQSGNLAQSFGALGRRKISRYVQIAKTLAPLVAQKEVIFCSHYLPHILPVLPWLNRKNFVCHFHGPAALEARVEGKGKLYCKAVRQLEKIVYKRAAYLTTDSKAFAALVSDFYGIPSSRVHAIPGAIDLEKHPWREKPSREREPFRLFCARRLVQRVGVDVLIKSAAVVKEKRISFELRIAGEGSQKDILESLVKRLNLTDCVEILGRISDEQLCDEYQQADISVVPTRDLEGFGLVILESLAAGTPVLGTKVGAIPEILEPFGPYFLAQPGCELDLAGRIIFLANNRHYLPSPSSCRDFVKQHYAPSVVVKQHLDLYRQYFGQSFLGAKQNIPFISKTTISPDNASAA